MSFPSGRQRMAAKIAPGCPFKLAGRPTKAARVLDDGEDGDEGEDEGEDEETLELQLAEIQARLRLKQLQKKRARSGTTGSYAEDTEEEHIRPTFALSRPQTHALVPKSPQNLHRRTEVDEVQVPVSPIKREAPPEPWSPQRYRMGIDKGWKANDVSLKRPPRPRTDARPASQLGTRSGAMSRSSDVFSSRPQTSPGGGGSHPIKSFSERMAEGRAAEKSRLERAERVQANRSSAFQLNKAEVDAFKTAAANRAPSPTSSSRRESEVPNYSRADIMRALTKPRNGGLTRSETAPNVREGNRKGTPSEEVGDSSKFEAYSGQHLSSRVLPHSFLSRTLAEKKILCIPDLLKSVKAPDFELPDEIDGDFVVFGIVASKSDPKQKQNTGNSSAKAIDPYDDGLNNTDRYMVITLTDLKWTIDLFLFDTAFPRYYRVSTGTLIAILNPAIMPPPKHKLDTNRFSLVLSSSDDKVLEIGHSRDIGYCKAMKKDGKTCQAWVDGRKTEFCDFHVDIQIQRTLGQRMDVNGSTGMFGPGGKSGSRTGFFGEGKRRTAKTDPNAPKRGLKPEGAQYDWSSQSTYYVAPAPKNHGNRSSHHPNASGDSAANLLDAVNDDPFIAAGMMGRGMENKEERLRRRLATQQREREITEKLISGRSGVGADYLRSRTANESPSANGNKDKPVDTPSTPKTLPQSSSMGLASFGKAKNVRLSPMKRANANPHGSGVKKTRFITANGIREAGRDSLGGPAEPGTSRRQVLSDDDDDELDII
ncbi:hypothetical protein PENDEC_c005G05712 [Penicillium decumbens]|uniref:Uncharacterized protein n=1 Tax=Penicillium decumbens TaxID=69771 RepID=A0A1V6PFZ0_PENDC|nr:hypothetical protein PENDEC_c005G05712 [Penicillium decumbens]